MSALGPRVIGTLEAQGQTSSGLFGGPVGVVRALNSVGRGQAGRGKDLSPQSPCAHTGHLPGLSHFIVMAAT